MHYPKAVHHNLHTRLRLRLRLIFAQSCELVSERNNRNGHDSMSLTFATYDKSKLKNHDEPRFSFVWVPVVVFQEVRGKTPTAFKLRNFSPGKRIRVTVSVGEFGQEREAKFTTTSDKKDWKVAA